MTGALFEAATGLVLVAVVVVVLDLAWRDLTKSWWEGKQ